jgi:hypothetical protein
MSSTVKIAISLPEEDYKELESERIACGYSRSRFVVEALKAWKANKEEDRLVKAYEDGYRNLPEEVEEAELWQRSSLDVLSKEEW